MWKKLEARIFYYFMVMSVASLALILALIIFSIVYRGLPHLTWELVSQTPQGGFYIGRGGGLLNAIIGSLYLTAGAVVLSLILSLPVALSLNIHFRNNKKFVNGVRFVLDILWGIPAIVYGAFGFILMIFLGIQASLLAGIIAVGLFILPIMIRSMDEVMKNVPLTMLESAYSLGSTNADVSFKVMIRQTFPGIVTAVMLGFGRGVGDVAAVMFTAGFSDNIPTSLMQQTATLPLAVFFQLGSPIEVVQNRAYASALLLIIIILLVSVLSRIIGNHFKKNIIK